jgi:hypothetical protein
MTIFDTIKYPISNPVTNHEFDKLPVEIHIEYWNWERLPENHNASYEVIYQKVKQLILDYDNDNIS